MKPTQVIADHRESKSGVGEYLAALPGVRLRWEKLWTGDYIVEEGAIFERKTASDFAASLLDQRLFSQAKRLADQPLRAAFIIEGSTDDWSRLGIGREALQGALNNARTDLRPRRFPFAESERNIPNPDLRRSPIR